MSPIVVTGLGTVSAAGAGSQALAEALARGATTLSPIDRSDGLHRRHGSRLAALAEQVDLSPWLSPRQARRMSWPSKYAAAAATMALQEAELGESALADGRTAVALASAFGTARYAEALIAAILTEGPESASPFHFSESVANAPAAQIAILCRARGANVAVTQREAGPIQATILGARELALGRSRRALTGTSEEINPLVHAVLDRFRALACDTRGRGERALPFDRGRNGFVAAEGGTVLVLEHGEDAAARNRTPLATVRAWARAFDPTAPAHGWGTGAKELAAGLGRALQRQGVDPVEVDLVISGASGSRAGDLLEARVLRHLFGKDGIPPIIAPKAVTGEYGGGQLAAAVLAASGRFWPSPLDSELDQEVGLGTWAGKPTLAPPRRLLVSCLAAGGAAAWLVLDAV